MWKGELKKGGSERGRKEIKSEIGGREKWGKRDVRVEGEGKE